MEANNSTVHHIHTGTVLSIAGGQRAQLRVLRGSVWLTEEGLSADRFLAAGDEVALRPNANAVLQALRPANVRVTRDAPGGAGIDRAARSVGGGLARLGQRAAALRMRLHLGPHDELAVAP